MSPDVALTVALVRRFSMLFCAASCRLEASTCLLRDQICALPDVSVPDKRGGGCTRRKDWDVGCDDGGDISDSFC